MRTTEKKKTDSSSKSEKSVTTLKGLLKAGGHTKQKIKEEGSNSSKPDDSKLEALKRSGERHATNKTNKQTVDNNIEEEEQHREDKLIDKLILSNAKENIILNNLIDNVDIENKLFDFIDSTSAKIGLKTITSPREENETHKLIDTREYQRLKKENMDLIKQKELINFKYNELVKANNKIVGELNFLISLAEGQKKNKTESGNKIRDLIKTSMIMKESNEKLKNVLLTEKTEKDNIFRAILSSINRSDETLGKEFKNIYLSFINQDFLNKNNDEEDKIDNLMGKIKFLEKEISEKKFELNGLKKFLIGDQNKNNKIQIRAVNKKPSIKKN